MKLRIGLGGVIAVAATYGLFALAPLSPSWDDLSKSRQVSFRGGKNCFVAGTQWCPYTSPPCFVKTNCSTGVISTYPWVWELCGVAVGDFLNDPYPAEAKSVSAAGSLGKTTTANYRCGTKESCDPECWWNAGNDRFECQTGPGTQWPLTVTKSVPSGGACTPDEE